VRTVSGEVVVLELELEAREPAVEGPEVVLEDPGPSPATPAEEAAADREMTQRIVLYSGIALAVAGAGTGVFFWLKAGGHDDDANLARHEVVRITEGDPVLQSAPCTTENARQSSELLRECVNLRGSLADRDSAQNTAVVGFALAGVGALVGAAALVFWTPEESQAFLVTPTLGGLSVSGRF
jgi:hypothetical protein